MTLLSQGFADKESRRLLYDQSERQGLGRELLLNKISKSPDPGVHLAEDPVLAGKLPSIFGPHKYRKMHAAAVTSYLGLLRNGEAPWC